MEKNLKTLDELKIFNHKEFGEIRSVKIDGEPYFVGRDVAKGLGYKKPENAIANHVDEEDKTTILIQGIGSNYKSKTVMISESGLYSLVSSSKMPKAKRFKKYLFDELFGKKEKDLLNGLFSDKTKDSINNETKKAKNIRFFNHEDFGEVRVEMIDDEPYFMLADICRVLEIGNPSQVKSRLMRDGVISNEVIDSLGRKQKAMFINEPNLYKLTFQSRKPQAEKFSNWVTSEVLPSIRKTGSYSVNQSKEDALLLNLVRAKTKDEMLLRVSELEQYRKEQIAERDEVIKLQEPKANFYDEVLESKSAMTATELAKRYGISAKELNRLLHLLGIQYNVNGCWVLYSKYQGLGYTDICIKCNDNRARSFSKWTAKGMEFIHEQVKGMLNKNGTMSKTKLKDFFRKMDLEYRKLEEEKEERKRNIERYRSNIPLIEKRYKDKKEESPLGNDIELYFNTLEKNGHTTFTTEFILSMWRDEEGKLKKVFDSYVQKSKLATINSEGELEATENSIATGIAIQVTSKDSNNNLIERKIKWTTFGATLMSLIIEDFGYKIKDATRKLLLNARAIKEFSQG